MTAVADVGKAVPGCLVDLIPQVIISASEPFWRILLETKEGDQGVCVIHHRTQHGALVIELEIDPALIRQTQGKSIGFFPIDDKGNCFNFPDAVGPLTTDGRARLIVPSAETYRLVLLS